MLALFVLFVIALAAGALGGLVGVFFLAMIPVRRLAHARQWRVRLWHLAIAGVAVGFLTGLVLSTGPLSVPIFTGYGLTGGAFLRSEAAGALVLYVGKISTFGQLGALNVAVVARGLVIGAALMIGPFVTRSIVRRAHPRQYAILIDLVLVVAAAGMFIATATS